MNFNFSYRKNMSVFFRYFSILLFFICMPFYGFCTTDDCVYSWHLFLFGWITAVTSISNATWIANVFLVFSWICIRDNNLKYAIIFSVFSIFIMLVFYFQYPRENSIGGVPTRITSIETGYYLWLASAVAAFIGSLFVPKRAAVTNNGADESVAEN